MGVTPQSRLPRPAGPAMLVLIPLLVLAGCPLDDDDDVADDAAEQGWGTFKFPNSCSGLFWAGTFSGLKDSQGIGFGPRNE